MTTREATPYLPRATETEAGAYRRGVRGWASLLAIGVVQWPWLLRSLSGGPPKARAALLAKLGLPGAALPTLGSWKADAGFLTLLADHVLEHRPERIVEFGAGATTLVLARALRMAGRGSLTSFDQHHDFVEHVGHWIGEHGLDADIRAVPLAPAPDGRPGLWYDHGLLPERIDLLVIDGPPWTIHPLTRMSAETLFDRIPAGGAVLLDDGARPGERLIARGWRRRWPGFDFRLVGAGTKGTLIGTRRR